MKRAILLMLSVVTLGSGCRKHKETTPASELAKLPPATQVGANTFGCLINGKAFLPKGPSLSPILFCYYQYLNGNGSFGYFFGLSASDKSNSSSVSGVSIFTDSLRVAVGAFGFSSPGKGQLGGRFTVVNDNGVQTRNSYFNSGVLTITTFDPVNQVVAGTFWFTAVGENNDTVRVTDGRFDMHFTQ